MPKVVANVLASASWIRTSLANTMAHHEKIVADNRGFKLVRFMLRSLLRPSRFSATVVRVLHTVKDVVG